MSVHHERRLAVEGTTNLRDLGGYRTTDGCNTTKWGLVFRSDALNAVPAAVGESLLRDQLHIHTTFDLRKTKEVASKPYDFPGIKHMLVPTDPSVFSEHAAAGKPFTAEITHELMLELYRGRIDHFAHQYTLIFRYIVDVVCARELESQTAHLTAEEADKKREAVLFHCTAGKDRTGWMAALLLTALGVPNETILADFMLTNKYLIRPADAVNYMGGLGMDEASMDALWTVKESYLNEAFRYVNEKYGGMQAYLKDKVGLSDKDLETLRAALLESVVA